MRISLILMLLLLGTVAIPARLSSIKLLTDNIPDYSNMDRLAHSLADNWATDEQKALAFYRWVAYARHESGTTYENGVHVTDPVKQFASYGFNHCAYTSMATTALATRLGYAVNEYDMPCGHTIGEIVYGGKGRMIDADFGFYFRRKDDRGLAGFVELHDAWIAGGGDTPPNRVFLPAATPYYCATTTYPLPEQNGKFVYATYFEENNRTFYNELSCIGNYDTTRNYSRAETTGTFLLSLKPGETYTRYWNQLDTTEDYYIPRGGENVNSARRMHVNGNGLWELKLGFGVLDFIPRIERDSGTALSGSTPEIGPGVAGGTGIIEVRVDGGNIITGGRIYPVLYRRTADDSIVFKISTDNGQNWKSVYSIGADTGLLRPTIRLSDSVVGQKYSYLLRVEMIASGEPLNIGLDSLIIHTFTQVASRTLPFLTAGTNRVLFDLGSQAAGADFSPVEVTFAWTENRTSGKLDRTHTEVISDSGRHEYYINTIGPRWPTMKWLRLRLRDSGPKTDSGYSDATDVGFGYERPRYFVDIGWELALKKKYTAVPASDLLVDPGTYLTNGRTPYLQGSIPQITFTPAWTAGKNPIITLGLDTLKSVAGVKMLQYVNVSGQDARYADSIQVFTSADSQTFDYQATVYESDVWNPPTNHLWPSRYDMFRNDSNRYLGISVYNFPAFFPAKVDCRFVRLKAYNSAGPLYLSKLTVFDEMPHQLVLDEFAHGFALKALPIAVEAPGADDAIARFNAGLLLRLSAANPFSNSVAFDYASAGGVAPKAAIFDPRGRMVRAVSLSGPSGRFVWDGTAADGVRLAPGLYVVRIEAGRLMRTLPVVKMD